MARWLAAASEAGLAEPNAMVLATAGADATPTARTVLLKGLDERGLAFFTNTRSRKGSDLRENPRATVVFPWTALERQIVVTGDVREVTGEEADAYWRSRPRGSRLGALASPQGEVLPSREALDAARRELEHRFPEGAEIPRPEHWSGFRLLPELVELWQGRPDRLHDRLRYRRRGGPGGGAAWTIERLAP